MNKINEATTVNSSEGADTVKSYKVRQTAGTNRFRVTIPKDILLPNGVEESQELGFRPEVAADGRVKLVYTTDLAASQKTIMLSLSNTGVVSIPSVFATAVDIGTTEVAWSAVPTDNGFVEFRGQTSITLPEVTPSSARLLDRKSFDWREQSSVEHDGRTWSQEQFRYYLTKSARDGLGWDINQKLRVGVRHRGDRAALVFEPLDDDAGVPDNLVKHAGPSSPSQSDAMLYIPNDIVRSLGLVGEPLMWLDDGGTLIAVTSD